MACFSEDCNFVKKNGDCFYDGVPPSNSPKTCEECRFFKPITNADRIRAMTGKELAEWMASKVDCLYCSVRSEWCTESEAACISNWLDWLKRGASDD